jgi:hypothetical protein
MKIKFTLFILVFGFVFDFIGSWLKITHHAHGDEMVLAAAIFKIVGLLAFTFLILGHPKVREFLNEDKFKDAFKD